MSEEYNEAEEPQRIVSDIGQWAMLPAWVRKALRSDAGKVDIMALAVFAVLAEKADHYGDRADFRSTKVIAEELGVDPGTVRRSLQHLREVGAVEWTQRVRPDGSRSTNDYTVFFVDPARMGAGTPARERAHHNVRALVRDAPARQDAHISQTSSIHTSNQRPTLVVDGVRPGDDNPADWALGKEATTALKKELDKRLRGTP